jgi:hypothetical protein
MTMRIMIACLLLIAAVGLVGCAGSGPVTQIDPTVQLTVSFHDPHWNGIEVPVSGRCGDCGGRGMSPALHIGGLPAQATEVTVAFNDLRIIPLSTNGGHGTLGVSTGGKSEVFLPSVPEESMSLPRGVRCVRKHQCAYYGHKAGAYKAPCGCGQGNEYEAVIRAVRRVDGKTTILAETKLALGVF